MCFRIQDAMEPEHLIIESEISFDPKYDALMEVVTVYPIGDCFVNGQELNDSTQLKQGDVLEFASFKFLFNNPVEANRMIPPPPPTVSAVQVRGQPDNF